MSGLGAELKNLGASITNTGQDIVGSGKGFVAGIKNLKNNATTRAVIEETGTKLPGPIAKSFRFARNIVEYPLAIGVKGVRMGVTGIGNFYRKAPLIAVPLTVIGGIAGVSSVMRRSAEKRQERETQAQLAMIEAQMQANAMQQPMAQANTYQITPEEAALLDARMKGAQGPQTGHADSVMAARQAAEAAQAAGSPVVAPSV